MTFTVTIDLEMLRAVLYGALTLACPALAVASLLWGREALLRALPPVWPVWSMGGPGRSDTEEE